MTKADIVDRVSESLKIPKNEAYAVVEQLFEIMKSALETGVDLKIARFGNFEVRKKRERQGRNPQTGETITIDARRILTFRPSAILRQALND